MINTFVYNISDNSQLLSVMQNIGLAILTVLIPLALFLYEKSTEEKFFQSLDRMVVIDHLLNAKDFLIRIALIFIPLLFWDINLFPIRILIISLWATGVGLTLVMFSKPYEWIRNNRSKYRFEYLKKISGKDGIRELWLSVWEGLNNERKNDREFFTIFTSHIDKLLSSNNPRDLELVAQLLGDSQLFIKNRPVAFLTSRGDIFQEILKWYFIVWQREYKSLVKKEVDDYYIYHHQISSILDVIMQLIIAKTLKEGHSYGLFAIMNEHVKNYGKTVIKSERNHYYLTSLMHNFYTTFFASIKESRERYDIWQHYFPHPWKITRNNIKNESNIVARVSLDEFLRWAEEQIRLKEDFNSALEDVSKELFPEVEPMFWSIILTFLMRSWTDSQRMKSLIENPRNFGFMGRIMTSSNVDNIEGIMEESRLESTKNTIELIYTIFPRDFSKDKLEKYITELESLGYEDKRLESYRVEILGYFKQMLGFLENNAQK